MSRNIIDFYKVFVKFSLIINNIFLKINIKGRGVNFVNSIYIDVITVLLYIVDKAI